MPNPEKKPIPIRIYNGVSMLLGLRAKLDFDHMIKTARKHTGHSDLGIDFNEEALRILIKSVNEEANLSPFGRLMIREKLLGQLENRLWASYWFKKFPEITEADLLPVIMVTGLQRTGTTKMQRLLSSLPGARGLASWEALYPAPLKSKEETKERIYRTRRNEKAVKWISPAFHAIHPIHADQPEEDVLLLDLHFMSTSNEAVLHVPAYADWLSKQDQVPVYCYEKKLLQLLQWQRGGKFWVLKSPHHLEYLDAFTKVFPESSIVWMHRSISSCVPSFLNMLYVSRGMFSDRPDENELKDAWMHKLEIMIENGIRFREKSPEKITDVLFDNFMKAENEVIQSICQANKIEFQPGDLTGILNKKYISRHQYSLKDWGLTKEKLTNRFSSYEHLISTLKSNENP